MIILLILDSNLLSLSVFMAVMVMIIFINKVKDIILNILGVRSLTWPLVYSSKAT